MGINMEQLQKLNKAERIAVTEHGRQRLIERGIMISDVMQCIKAGEIIKQYEDDKPFPSCLILGTAANNKYVHVVLSHDDMWIYLITAYYPDSDLWESDFRRKRGGQP